MFEDMLSQSGFIMGSLTPPWADELLARNSKVARKMMSSMSTESYFEDEPPPQPRPGPPNRFLSFTSPPAIASPDKDQSSPMLTPKEEGEKVDDPPANPRMASFQSTRSSSTSSLNGRSHQNKQKQRNTEKLSPIRNECDAMFVEDDESLKKEMTNGIGNGGSGGGEDLSILEYGPGIVKKLRSRYQSLALRQYANRPTLRRSASLENVLDAVSAEELAATLESKLGSNNQLEDEMTNGKQRGRNRFQNSSGSTTTSSPAQVDSRTSSPAGVPFHTATTTVSAQQNGEVQTSKPLTEQNGKVSSAVGTGTPRGRMDASARRDRMRRARSVDALHRTKREEEILEKFKHVVLPKEEIVIIEVSKPLAQEGSVSAFNQQGTNENGTNLGGSNAEKRFPTRLLLTSNNFKNSTGILDQQTVVRNLMASPEHELPPHDIVRETARIFERNQENLNRRIGQALRLSKSQSATAVVGVGSPPPASPTPTTTTSSSSSSTISSTSNNTASQQKPVTAQSTTTSSPAQLASSPSSAMQPSQDKSFPTASPTTIPPTKTSSNKVDVNTNAIAQANNAAMANGPSSHGQKQIGIIKPTLSNNVVISNNKQVINGSAPLGSSGGGNENRVRSPILSPIQFLTNQQKPLIQSSQKPPLSPKPIFTSSPKVNFPGTGGGGVVNGATKGKPALAKESPSPILIIDNRERSLSPFKSESPIPRAGDLNRVKSSPISRSVETPPDSLDERSDSSSSSVRTPSPPVNGKLSPVKNEAINNVVLKRVGNTNNSPLNNKSPVKEGEREIVILKSTKPNSNLQNGHTNSTDHRQQISNKDSVPPPPPRTTSSPSFTPPVETPKPAEDSSNNAPAPAPGNKQVSQLRVHQKQKSSQGGNGSMVFNFTTRKDVPDYIEDDGLRKTVPGGDGRMGSAEEGVTSMDSVDNRFSLALFEGGNVIINGKSSIQKKPKSQKLSISFNEEAITMHEYPSESSLLLEDDPTENSPKKPNVISGGSSLGSYTPKVGSNSYQLGSYSPFENNLGQISNKKGTSNGGGKEEENDFIEDYLKPNTESTTWSNEMSSDILF